MMMVVVGRGGVVAYFFWSSGSTLRGPPESHLSCCCPFCPAFQRLCSIRIRVPDLDIDSARQLHLGSILTQHILS